MLKFLLLLGVLVSHYRDFLDFLGLLFDVFLFLIFVFCDYLLELIGFLWEVILFQFKVFLKFFNVSLFLCKYLFPELLLHHQFLFFGFYFFLKLLNYGLLGCSHSLCFFLFKIQVFLQHLNLFLQLYLWPKRQIKLVIQTFNSWALLSQLNRRILELWIDIQLLFLQSWIFLKSLI